MDPVRLYLEREFPKLAGSLYDITSCRTDDYNCIAWAAGVTDQWWWPSDPPQPGDYWPPGITRNDSVSSFIEAFATLGYTPCANGRFDPRFEKVAFYALGQNETRHAARQLDNGQWTSKLGPFVDIRHVRAADVENLLYGQVVQYVRRHRPGLSPRWSIRLFFNRILGFLRSPSSRS